MKLKVKKRLISLEDLPMGSLFMHNDTLALKSEYRTSTGAVEATIVGSGEMFWGGTSSSTDQTQLLVREVKVKLKKK